MARTLHYGATAKVFHWLIVLLLVVQFPLGWLMPDIHPNMQPGDAMTVHISIGMCILALIALRLIWRLGHPVAPDHSLPAWQRVSSEGLHWLLYALVLVTTMTGWIFASQRGWSISLFYALPLPMLTEKDSPTGHMIGEWHQTVQWVLAIAIGVHIAAALVHIFVYRDRIMQRMLPG